MACTRVHLVRLDDGQRGDIQAIHAEKPCTYWRWRTIKQSEQFNVP